MDPAQLANAVTERVTIPVLGGVENWKEQLKFMLQTLGKQPGYLRTRWGPWSEDQQKLELITGWINPEACEKWKKSKDYTEAMGRFAPVLGGEPSSYLLQFKPYAPQTVINSPVVETLSFEDCREPEDRMRQVVERATRMPGCNGVASGYSLRPPSSSGGGGGGTGDAGRTFVAAIGWTGLEASRRADKTAYTGGMKTDSHHVDFNFPVKGFGGL
ncbi:dimeric alpha-beta barrel containing protein [Colletotrichum tofieldiae]|nr:dimeric alpha-beta barrel containing protein [Colletotrichum tofieldiae]GKT75020.1 dimeric alpha-beta barrel containing protein [Colletotrichum tofieldiae]